MSAAGRVRAGRERWPLLFLPLSVLVLLFHHAAALRDPFWVPVHDTLTQYTEFLYAFASLRNGELPLWNSYWHAGQPFYLLLNHGLLLNPLYGAWMGAGILLDLTPQQTYLWTQMTGIVVFALGGFFLSRLLTRNTFAATASFLILLFSGEACYWMTQVYSLHVIMYVPWVLFVVARYAVRPSLKGALTAALVLGIALNTYYPAYLFAFTATLAALFAFFHRRLLLRLPFRVYARHAIAAVPLLAVLLLPTYLIYREITADYYQIARDAGPGVRAPDIALSFDPVGLGDSLVTLAGDIFRAPHDLPVEGVPLVGAVAVALALWEAGSRSRRSGFWLLALLMAVLYFHGPMTPVHALSQMIIPFYRIIRTFPFFSGFIVLCLAMLAAFGLERSLLGMRRSRRLPRGAASLAAGLALGALLVNGGLHMGSIFKGPYHTARHSMFSYDDRFSFSLGRPADYSTVQPLGSAFSGECCIGFYHLAERFDAPYHFDRWQSMHTLFLPRSLYEAAKFAPLHGEWTWKASVPGFEATVNRKFHWFTRYAVAAAPGADTDADPQVLLLADDAAVRDLGLRVSKDAPAQRPSLPSQEPEPPTLMRKTANTLAVSVELGEPHFLLYTDLYHPGFRALIDGNDRPVLKGMGVFKALELEAGRHTVEFRFEPLYRYALIIYLAISLPALLILGALSVASVVRT